MGLDLEVGAVASLGGQDPEGTAHLEGQLAAINRALRAAGLPEHREPTQLAEDERWSAGMYGYSGLHYLRRIAAHLAFGRSLPEPGGDDASEDPLLMAYYADVDGRGGGWLARLRGKPRLRREFDHLIVHGDAEGVYLPIDFPEVLVPDATLGVDGGMVGSSHALLRECDRLAAALGIPSTVGPEDEALWDAADAQGDGDGWQRYGVESFTCVRLREGARRSVQTGAVLLFT